MIKNVLLLSFLLSSISTYSQSADAKMRAYVDALMRKMTLEEKIGQLNLITPGGGILTGAVVSTDVEQKIKAGNVGNVWRNRW